MDSHTLAIVATTALAAYLALVRALRWRKYNAIHRKYARKFRQRSLTPAEAQEVVQLGLGHDMPYIMIQALSFALFKTYGIPSISKLLLATKEISTKDNVSRRIADTGLMIGSWTSCPINGRYPSVKGSAPCDPRAMISVARMNWIHSKYHISNDDFLYTLALFLFEPLTWAENYGWRPCSELEKYSWFVYWTEIGKRMNITDIPPTFEELREWSLEYEEQYMKPASSNYEVARHTTDELLFYLPKAFGIKDFARRMMICMLGDRVREAMLADPQPWYVHAVLRGVLRTTAFVQKHLLLPRWKMESLATLELPPVEPGTGKIARTHPHWYQPRPWYRPEPKNILEALTVRVSLWAGLYEQPPGPRWKSEGYYLDEMGPPKFEKEGQSEVMRQAERMLGCPIPREWVRDEGEKEGANGR
ncbi:hypothetical protein HDZ31DRAFT_46073 [Schizophyllum fasciatum]